MDQSVHVEVEVVTFETIWVWKGDVEVCFVVGSISVIDFGFFLFDRRLNNFWVLFGEPTK
jgi:hypothetical protein